MTNFLATVDGECHPVVPNLVKGLTSLIRHLPMMPYGAKWRVFRKHFHSLFRIQEVEPMRPAILDLSSEFLHHLRNTPNDFRQLIRSYTAKSISKFVFSHDQPLNTEDPYLTLNDELMAEFNGYFFGNVFLVDVFPFCKLLLQAPFRDAKIT